MTGAATNDQTVTQALKPCPRCGGQAFVTIQFGVMCEVDRCLHLPPRANREEAITAWNTRTAHSGEGLDHPLLRYVQHLPACKLKMRMGGRCDCGLSDLRRSSEGRSNGAGEDALDRLAVRVLHDYRKRDGLTCYNYDHNRLRDERYMRETFAELVAPFLAALSAPQGEVERLRAAALTDDPDRVCAGIPDHAIEAGIEAWKAAESDIELRARCENPEDVTDWDEGMIVAAIFKAIGTALAQPEAGGE